MRVLIIGGGPAGILMAQVFQKCNIPAVVFEKSPTRTSRPRDWNFGIYWAQSRLEECLPPSIMAELATAQTDINNKPSAETVLPVFDGITGELMSPLPAPWAVRYRRRGMLEVMERGVDVRYGKGIASLEATGEGVTVRFTDGTEEKGDFVIGAEGAHSVVREFLFRGSPDDAKLLKTPIWASTTVGTMEREVAVECRDRSRLCHITLDRNGLFTFVSSEFGLWLVFTPFCPPFAAFFSFLFISLFARTADLRTTSPRCLSAGPRRLDLCHYHELALRAGSRSQNVRPNSQRHDLTRPGLGVPVQGGHHDVQTWRRQMLARADDVLANEAVG
jgi:hypothetical protein